MLLAADFIDVYQPQSLRAKGIQAVQFLRNGKSVLVGSEGRVDTGTWWIDSKQITALLADNRKVSSLKRNWYQNLKFLPEPIFWRSNGADRFFTQDIATSTGKFCQQHVILEAAFTF